MKSYTFIINGKKYNTKIKDSAPGTRIVVVNGVEYEVEIQGEKEAYEARRNAVEAAKSGSHSKEPIPTIGGRSKTMSQSSTNDVLSPIPGLILDIIVKEGDKVSVGDLLLKMEAMKMENEIKSTTDGTVTGIHVKKGDSVLEGQKLVTIE